MYQIIFSVNDFLDLLVRIVVREKENIKHKTKYSSKLL